MKLSREGVHHLAETLVARLEAQGQLDVQGARAAVVGALERAVTDELQVEDRLNAEVRTLLRSYQAEIDAGRVDYQKMFTMIKAKLARERGLIL
jgi:hypothetical protein